MYKRQIAYKAILEVYKNKTRSMINLVIAGKLIETTPGHLFRLSQGAWRPASELKVGDTVITSNGIKSTVESTEIVEYDEDIDIYKDVYKRQVLGYEAWKRFGRQVVGKNTGIKILVPHFVREYEGKGSLLKYIKDNISSQFKKKPDLDYAHFNLKGTRLGFNGYKNGLYDVTLDNKSIKGHITEETLRKFLMQSVIGKVPTRYSVGTVFDVSNKMCIRDRYNYTSTKNYCRQMFT